MSIQVVRLELMEVIDDIIDIFAGRGNKGMDEPSVHHGPHKYAEGPLFLLVDGAEAPLLFEGTVVLDANTERLQRSQLLGMV